MKIPLKSITDKRFFLLIWQFIKFGIVGLSNTIVSNLICYIFIYINKDYIYIGQTLGFIVSVLNAYLWNNRYVFKRSPGAPRAGWKGHLKAILRVYMAYGFTLLLGYGLTYIMRNKLEISEWIIPVILLIICTPINFITNKFWAFKERSGKKNDEG